MLKAKCPYEGCDKEWLTVNTATAKTNLEILYFDHVVAVHGVKPLSIKDAREV